MHSEGDNWHWVPTENMCKKEEEYSDQSAAEDKILNELQV